MSWVTITPANDVARKRSAAARTQIERDTHIGAIVRDKFYEYERRRDQRRLRT